MRTFASNKRSEKNSYYSLLGVDPLSSPDQIKKAYTEKAKQLHPDVSKDPKANIKFNKILEAYNTLADQAKRAEYDRSLGYNWGPNYSPEFKDQEFFNRFQHMSREKNLTVDANDSQIIKRSKELLEILEMDSSFESGNQLNFDLFCSQYFILEKSSTEESFEQIKSNIKDHLPLELQGTD